MACFGMCLRGNQSDDFDLKDFKDSVSRNSEDSVSRNRVQEVSGPVTIDVERVVSMPVPMSEVPRVAWVIGLDFGTSNSGFAFAQATDNPTVYCHYDWPKRGEEMIYCKTLTGLYYTRNASTGRLTCTSWGHLARSDYMQQEQGGDTSYLTAFKLLLKEDLNDPELLSSMPPSLTPADIITTYLKLIGEYALSIVEACHRGHVVGSLFAKDAVRWYVTVPSIWDENAKQQMKECMVRAGLVLARRIEDVQVVLEPEAASFYCHQEGRKDERKAVSLDTNDKILVADVGGGTVDIVVQEMIGNSQNYTVKELTESSGGQCGGRYVDARFFSFLAKKISCLEEFLKQRPGYRLRLLKSWDEIKSSFGDDGMLMTSLADTKDIDLGHELAERWEAACKNTRDGQPDGDYSVVSLTEQDLKAIFDPVVDEILKLIADQLQQVPDIKVIFVVGGFAGSPYLMRRIHARFEKQVKHIVRPDNPGNAIVHGAVLLALHPNAIVSRVSRKPF